MVGGGDRLAEPQPKLLGEANVAELRHHQRDHVVDERHVAGAEGEAKLAHPVMIVRQPPGGAEIDQHVAGLGQILADREQAAHQLAVPERGRERHLEGQANLAQQAFGLQHLPPAGIGVEEHHDHLAGDGGQRAAGEDLADHFDLDALDAGRADAVLPVLDQVADVEHVARDAGPGRLGGERVLLGALGGAPHLGVRVGGEGAAGIGVAGGEAALGETAAGQVEHGLEQRQAADVKPVILLEHEIERELQTGDAGGQARDLDTEADPGEGWQLGGAECGTVFDQKAAIGLVMQAEAEVERAELGAAERHRHVGEAAQAADEHEMTAILRPVAHAVQQDLVVEHAGRLRCANAADNGAAVRTVVHAAGCSTKCDALLIARRLATQSSRRVHAELIGETRVAGGSALG